MLWALALLKNACQLESKLSLELSRSSRVIFSPLSKDTLTELINFLISPGYPIINAGRGSLIRNPRRHAR